MRRSIFMLLTLLILSVFCAGITVCADETETDASKNVEYEGLGYTVKNPDYWEGLKGSVIIYPASSTSISDDPEIYAAYLFYFPLAPEDLQDEEKADSVEETVAGMVFTVKGDREQLLEALKEMDEGETSQESYEENLIQVSEADGYQFFVLTSLDEAYAASLEEAYTEDYGNLPVLFAENFARAQFYAPVDSMKALAGKTLRFTSTDLDGNTVTSEELFGNNEITMVNLWGVWCINCVNEMEELAAIHERLQEKGCGIVGVEWEKDPGEETYRQAREMMAEKGTNYPSVLMPEGNEIFDAFQSFPTTFFVDREGTVLTKPIVGAMVKEYEPALEALLEGASIPETGAREEGSCIYRVFVKDEEGNPLEEVAVQFCDDTTCRFGETDEDGLAEFEVPVAKSYEVHIAEAPDGYAYDEDEAFLTDETASDTTIVLRKDE